MVFREGKLLITQRRPEAHLGSLWEFPGGKREPGETFEQCLQRELAEELGIETQVGPLVESIAHEYPERSVHLKFFVCRWLRHEAKPIDCLDLAWNYKGGSESISIPRRRYPSSRKAPHELGRMGFVF